MIFELIRDGYPSPNYGELFADGILIGQTIEDEDRHLETGGLKIYGQTAIPRGRYRIKLSFSQRFKRIMPEILQVPQFSGVRIHGGNTDADTLGCPLLGSTRTSVGIANCKAPNDRLIELLTEAEDCGEDNWIEVK